ncbi:MAG: HdeA/HdeB family chaperone [Caulobacteraceae bacterium]
MTTRIALIVFAASALVSGGALAQSPKPEGTVMSDRGGVEHTTTLFKTGKRLETVTCAQFNALDESFKPQALTYAANYGPKGHAHPTETVSGVERFRPDVVTACAARPGDHLLPHVRSAMTGTK